MGKTFFCNRGFRIFLVIVFLLSLIGMGTGRTSMSAPNEVTDQSSATRWFLSHFPYEDFVVVSWTGCTMDDDRLEMFAQKLVPGQTIDNMSDWFGDIPTLTAELDLKDFVFPHTPPAQNSKKKSKKKKDASEDPTRYFRSVLTGPRLKRLLEERYGPDSTSPMSEAQILDRLDGLLIGPHRTTFDGSPLPIEQYRSAMIISLNTQKNEKELRTALQIIRNFGTECGVNAPVPTDSRSFLARTKDWLVEKPYEFNGFAMGGPVVEQIAFADENKRTFHRSVALCVLIGLTVSMICLRSVVRNNKMVVVCVLFLTACFCFGIFNARTSTNTVRNLSPNFEIVVHYKELEEQLGPLVPMEIVIGFDNERCKFTTLERLRFIRQIDKTLREEFPDEIGGIMSAATFSPPTEGRGRPGSGTRRIFEYALNGRLEKYRRDLKDYIVIAENPLFLATDSNYALTLRQLDIDETAAVRLRAACLTSLQDVMETQEGEERPDITAKELRYFREKCRNWEKNHGTDLWRISLRVWSLKKNIDRSRFVDDVQSVVDPMIDHFLEEKFPDENFDENICPVRAVYVGKPPV